jgi:ubiquitin conjugation factor E4 B
LLLNDVAYLLDEGMSKIMDINRLQKELETQLAPTSFLRQTSLPDDREHDQPLATIERQAAFYLSLANEIVSILNKFTAFVPDAFMYPEVVDQLAGILNFNQFVLVGDKCNHLKVKNPDKYHFSPSELLSMIVDIYLNLRMKEEFITACGRDGRSYRHEIFIKTTVILKKYSLKTPSEIEEFEKFVEMVEETKVQDEEWKEALEDIPEPFLGLHICCSREC